MEVWDMSGELGLPGSALHRCRRMFVITLWIQIWFVAVAQSEDGAVNHPSDTDVALCKDESDLECFTRTGSDFTCSIVTSENRTYHLVYTVNGKQSESRCEVLQQEPEEGTFRHVCPFPASDVYLFVETHLELVDRSRNGSLCSRTVSVEDHFLVGRPVNVSLQQNDRAGQLLVSWDSIVPTYCGDKTYRIQYSSEGLKVRTKEVKTSEHNKYVLDSLVPGDDTEVKISVKCGLSPSSGHWSSWSLPVGAVVPQTADDVSLVCVTSDLQSVTCRWNRSKYDAEKELKLFYRMNLSEEWMECPVDGRFLYVCRFHGDGSAKLRVKLSRTPAPVPLSRTFFSDEFALKNIVQTPAPALLRGSVLEGNLCLTWEAPLLTLSSHLRYEIGYQAEKGKAWMMISLPRPSTDSCLKVPAGSLYSVKVRAKPNGSVYSGHWSAWSHVLNGHSPTDTGLWVALCVPVVMLLTAIFLISTYLSKLKHYFWPPVPNLDKVLHGFLTEIDKQRWNLVHSKQCAVNHCVVSIETKEPPLTFKQPPEETTASVLEVLSEDRTPGLKRPPEESSQPQPPGGALLQVGGNPGTEVSPDYVTLDKDTGIPCPRRISHTYEAVGGSGVGILQRSCPDVSGYVSPRLSSDFVNCSYLSLSLSVAAGGNSTGKPGNIYTNLP